MLEVYGIYNKEGNLVGKEIREKTVRTPKEDFKSFCRAFSYAEESPDTQFYIKLHPLTFVIFRENIREVLSSGVDNVVVDFILDEPCWFDSLSDAVLYADIDKVSFSMGFDVDSSVLHVPNLICVKMRGGFWKRFSLNNKKKLVDFIVLLGDFGVDAVAEDINNKADYILAVSLGFNHFQGDFFDRRERFVADENFA